jgi:protein FAM32A
VFLLLFPGILSTKQKARKLKEMPTFTGGKLKLKGSSSDDKKKKKKKRSREERESVTHTDTSSSNSSKEEKSISSTAYSHDPDEHLTDSQRKFEQKKRKAELSSAKNIVGTTYRDRVELFNYNLSVMSEHNDIPRISAAGNG